MAILVKYAPDDQGVDGLRDRLVAEFASQLTPSEWEAIRRQLLDGLGLRQSRTSIY